MSFRIGYIIKFPLYKKWRSRATMHWWLEEQLYLHKGVWWDTQDSKSRLHLSSLAKDTSGWNQTQVTWTHNVSTSVGFKAPPENGGKPHKLIINKIDWQQIWKQTPRMQLNHPH